MKPDPRCPLGATLNTDELEHHSLRHTVRHNEFRHFGHDGHGLHSVNPGKIFFEPWQQAAVG